MLVVVAQGSTEVEAQMICGRLEAAGIDASYRRSGTAIPQATAGIAHSVYVEDRDAQRAGEVLDGSEPGFSDEELARLAEEAGPPPPI
jgi:hypothetical protein